MGPVGQGYGAPWVKGEDHWRLDGKGLGQEQVWQGCEQEAKRRQQEEPVDGGMQEGARRPEDQGLLPTQEGHTFLREGEGALQPVSAALCIKVQMTGASERASSRCGDFRTC